MANKPVDMSKLKQVLRLYKNGDMSNRKIAETVELDKNTVNKYINQAKKDSLSIDELLALDDPVLAHRMVGGNAAYSDSRFDELKTMLPYLASELRRPHVTMQLLWEEYRKESIRPYGITQFKEHLNRYIAGTTDKTASTILKDLYVGGEKAFLDFAGGKMQYVDIDTGEIHSVEVFVACLPATDYGFAMAVPSQKVEDFIRALECFLRHIGGVPKILVPDNLKAAVIKRENGMPVLNKIFDDFCNHYGCVAIPARPVHPKDKSLVEDHVRIIYRRVFAPLRNDIFYSIEELNAAIAQKMKEHNQKRMQQRPQTREELFLAIEKPNLNPLPEKYYEPKFYTNLTVDDNCCVYLGRDMHYYSVPYKYIGFRMQIVYTATVVKIYTPDGMLVREWDRDRTPGAYSTKQEDMASNSQAYRLRSPAYYIRRSREVNENLGIVVETMFGKLSKDTPPEVLYHRCDALLRLQRTTEPRLFNLACEHARFRYQATIMETQFDVSRGLDKNRVMELATCRYIKSGIPVIITGPAGTGKSWLATALGHQACMLGFKVRYFHVFKLFEEITNNRIEGTLSKFFKKLADTDLLIIDDFGVRSLDKQQMLDFMELMEDRHGMKSTIIVSQLPVANWYDMMKVNSTAADAILDRIVHTAQRFELKGDSLRKK